MNQKALEAAARAVDAHYLELGFKLKPAKSRLAAQAAITAYLAAMEAEGFVMVPVEPTEEMKAAGAKGSGEDSVNVAWGAWDAMIAARPRGEG